MKSANWTELQVRRMAANQNMRVPKPHFLSWGNSTGLGTLVNDCVVGVRISKSLGGSDCILLVPPHSIQQLANVFSGDHKTLPLES